ncbi:MAG: hypothetical protein HYX85_00290 [Chloroflexi bacterium]|nr:hypothetical protein [Chloroflexota bacterium]
MTLDDPVSSTGQALVKMLSRLPEVRLQLLDMVRELVREDGQINPEKVSLHRKELDAAIAEAETYTEDTRKIVSCLRTLARLRSP